jgi:hypothetical protein
MNSPSLTLGSVMIRESKVVVCILNITIKAKFPIKVQAHQVKLTKLQLASLEDSSLSTYNVAQEDSNNVIEELKGLISIIFQSRI